jgi:hypothetical protein
MQIGMSTEETEKYPALMADGKASILKTAIAQLIQGLQHYNDQCLSDIEFFQYPAKEGVFSGVEWGGMSHGIR